MTVINGIPTSITRTQLIAVLEPLGIDLRDLIELTFARDGIHAEVNARDENGQVVVLAGNEIGRHRIFIKLEDE
jgi:hypothetical protein